MQNAENAKFSKNFAKKALLFHQKSNLIYRDFKQYARTESIKTHSGTDIAID